MSKEGDIIQIKVESESRPGTFYDVELDLDNDSATCTCPDHQYRKRACKHIKQVLEETLKGSIKINLTK